MAAVGVLLLTGLYFNLQSLVYTVIAMLFIDGITQYWLSQSACRLMRLMLRQTSSCMVSSSNQNYRFNIEAERLWYLIIGSSLFISVHFFEMLWFFPWFIGFAIFGFSISGVCPLQIGLRRAGFK
jgi:hypothetical protein